MEVVPACILNFMRRIILKYFAILTSPLDGDIIKTSMRCAELILAVLLLAWCLPIAGSDSAENPITAPTPSGDALEFFETKVRPLLVERCFECHGPEIDKPKGGLRLSSRDSVLQGGDSGPAVVPANVEESLLIQAIRYEGYEMPPDSKLSDEDIETLVTWVSLGVPWPSAASQSAPESKQDFDLAARRASHWCWQPLQSHPIPEVHSQEWPRDPIDNFVLARLEAEGMHPSPAAERSVWLRRVTYDLTGLPPTPEEILAFATDTDSNAHSRVVDRLLATISFGEHWARHWLDLVRYSESCGHEFDFSIPAAFQYRDYVIRAINSDVPFNQFVIEHIAGDLLTEPRRHSIEGYNESIIGTGFWFLHEATHGPVDVTANQASLLDNRIDVLGKTFLGLTLACARCHDHKFDAISTRDYYALSGVLKSTRRQEALLDRGDQIKHAVQQIEGLCSTLPVPSELQSPEDFSRYLLAASEYLRQTEPSSAAGDRSSNGSTDGAALQAWAHAHSLSSERLAHWTQALRSPDLANPQHSLQLWRDILMSSPSDSIAAWKARLLTIGEDSSKTYSKAVADKDHDGCDKIVSFHNFGIGTWNDWFATGFAFGDGPTDQPRSSDLGGTARNGRLADSGRFGLAPQGVLRSPTFEVSTDKIHFWACGQGTRVRILIDGYDMDALNPVLFSGLLAEVNTQNKFEWITLGGDLGRYKGHRAYLEILDQSSTGSIAVGQIVFNNSDPPVPNNPLTCDILRRFRGESISEADLPPRLATAYSISGDAALLRWAAWWNLESDSAGTSPYRQTIEAAEPSLRALEAQIPTPLVCQAACAGSPEDDRVHIRGSHKVLGDVVSRRFLEALGATPLGNDDAGGRLTMAYKIASAENPLTARVAANRTWHHLMGRGLVSTTDNLGVMGEPPSHPELLDFLATEFIRQNWSLKSMIRRIVLSSTYRQASHPVLEFTAQDPDNRCLHHMPVRRLSGESIRDTMLLLSGRLDRTSYGASVPVYLTPFMTGRGQPAHSGPLDGNGRRSIYLEVRRNFLSPFMLAFDTPIPFSTVGRRNISNVPAQALILMNDPFVAQQAEQWARRLLDEGPQLSTEARVRRMYLAAFTREADPSELLAADEFLAQQRHLYQKLSPQPELDPTLACWRDYCHVLFNSKELIFVP